MVTMSLTTSLQSLIAAFPIYSSEMVQMRVEGPSVAKLTSAMNMKQAPASYLKCPAVAAGSTPTRTILKSLRP